MIAYCCAGSFLRLFPSGAGKKLSTTIKGKLFSDKFFRQRARHPSCLEGWRVFVDTGMESLGAGDLPLPGLYVFMH